MVHLPVRAVAVALPASVEAGLAEVLVVVAVALVAAVVEGGNES